MINFSAVTGFDWDTGNARKSAEKHSVSQIEAEQVFFNQPLLVVADVKHRQTESRWHALGVTDAGRFLHITFTLRAHDTLIRVISARAMSRKARSEHFMKKSLKAMPNFSSEDKERVFWESPNMDSTAYLDWSKAEHAVFPNLKPSTKAISLRLPESLLSMIKVCANRMDVPYQSLIKTWLSEKVAETDRRSA